MPGLVAPARHARRRTPRPPCRPPHLQRQPPPPLMAILLLLLLLLVLRLLLRCRRRHRPAARRRRCRRARRYCPPPGRSAGLQCPGPPAPAAVPSMGGTRAAVSCVWRCTHAGARQPLSSSQTAGRHLQTAIQEVAGSTSISSTNTTTVHSPHLVHTRVGPAQEARPAVVDKHIQVQAARARQAPGLCGVAWRGECTRRGVWGRVEAQRGAAAQVFSRASSARAHPHPPYNLNTWAGTPLPAATHAPA